MHTDRGGRGGTMQMLKMPNTQHGRKGLYMCVQWGLSYKNSDTVMTGKYSITWKEMKKDTSIAY